MKKTLLASILLASVSASVYAGEVPIGDGVSRNGLSIEAVYLEPIDMEPKGMGLSAKDAEVHLEADIKALKGNKNGFAEGEWIPYLTVTYKLKNKDTGKVAEGTFMPMVANDGPHYGENIKMLGVGNYELTYHIEPPSKNGMHRHTDKETGVGKWWKPFDAKFKFKFVSLEEGQKSVKDEEAKK